MLSTIPFINLPVEIIFNENELSSITYLYDAAGVKKAKTVTQPGRRLDPPRTWATDYLDGFQYVNTNNFSLRQKAMLMPQ